MSSEQTQTKTYFNANIIVNSKNHHLLRKLFNIGILQQMFKISAKF